MKVSRHWLQQYVDLAGLEPEELARAFTFVGFEVEHLERRGLAPLADVVVGEVLVRDRHPNADRLSVCQVRVSPDGDPRQIVCGAQNYTVGDRVPVALPGAVLPGNFAIRESKIRGVESRGMMCSARELGLGDDHAGLLILADRPPVGTPIHEALGPGDVVFDVEITPNRPDALSHLGLARELAAWFGRPLAPPEARHVLAVADARPDDALLTAVEVEAPEACPLYSAHVVRGVRVGPSPDWLRRALESIGLRPINNVVDVTNFVLHETGQPLHAFDARRLRGARLRVAFASAGENLVTLDGKSRSLAAQHLTIRDAERPLVVAGVMGGTDAEVGPETTDLILEAAWFEPRTVRRAARQLGLNSDSSYRFERGVDPHGALPAARRALDLILECAGGTVDGPSIVVGRPPVWEREIVVRPSWVRARLGFEIDDAAQRGALERLGLTLRREERREDDEVVWTVAVPTWRNDLDRPIDLVEEILRLHGSDRVPPARVAFGAVVDEDDRSARLVRSASEFLAARGFLEAVNYTLRPAADAEHWQQVVPAAAFAVANPLSDDQSHLRVSLLPGLLDTLAHNRARQTGETRFFEAGRIFAGDAGSGEIFEEISVAGVVLVDGGDRSWRPGPIFDLLDARDLARDLAARAGIEVSPGAFLSLDRSPRVWQAGHAAQAVAEGGEVRLEVGLLALAYTRSLGLEGRVLGFSLALRPSLLARPASSALSGPPSAFPAAIRDVAVVAPTGQPAAEVGDAVARLAQAAAGSAFALERSYLFDVYTGPGLPPGTRSLAFSLVFRAPDRTLTDDEVNRALAALQAELGRAGFGLRS